jgi:LacI family transcriptional regulator
MAQKRVLLALSQHLTNLEKSILEYANKAGWILEFFSKDIPDGWYGDGVIVDAFSWDEIKNIRNYDKIPIVSSRLISAQPNLRFVIGNTRAIAKIAADCFIAHGFKNFASFTTHPPLPGSENEVAKIMPDWALKHELESRGHNLNMFYIREQNGKVISTNYRHSVARLRKFLRNLPKPCACFTTSVKNSYIFYRACEEENIKVPQEIAFLANNDQPEITENTHPTTSAIIGEIRNTGLCLAKTLDDMMNGIDVPLEPRLMEPSGIFYRQSTDILAVPDLQTAQAINFLLSNYMNQISVQDAAEHANLHPDMMNYLFQKHINKSPGRMLREVRMNKARELLTDTYLSLSKIAEHVGYGSAMSFSLAFKREHNMTPGEYRRKQS